MEGRCSDVRGTLSFGTDTTRDCGPCVRFVNHLETLGVYIHHPPFQEVGTDIGVPVELE